MSASGNDCLQVATVAACSREAGLLVPAYCSPPGGRVELELAIPVLT